MADGILELRQRLHLAVDDHAPTHSVSGWEWSVSLVDFW
jgi:hypothetical protein